MIRGLTLILILGMTMSAFAQVGYDTLPNLPDHYVKRLGMFRAEPTTSGRIVFLGNSITEGGGWKKLLKDSTVLNRGISGDNTYGVLRRLDEITRHKPSKLFILIGVNDLSKDFPNAHVIENIFAIVGGIHSASPKTQVFVQSLLPVNPTVRTFPSRFGKQGSIIEINGQLKKYAETLKYTFVDIHSAFLDAKNMLDARYTNDGLHLNPAGYNHWVAFLKKNKFL